MDDLAFVQKVNRVENLKHESPDKVQRQAVVTIALDQFVQVHRKQVKGHTLNDNKRFTTRSLQIKHSLSSIQFLAAAGSSFLIRVRIEI